MPPDAIRDVLEGVLMVLGQQDTSWNNMKKFLGQSSVKDDIINYDAHKVTDEIRSRVGTARLKLLRPTPFQLANSLSRGSW